MAVKQVLGALSESSPLHDKAAENWVKAQTDFEETLFDDLDAGVAKAHERFAKFTLRRKDEGGD